MMLRLWIFDFFVFERWTNLKFSEVEYDSWELPNLELKFFGGPSTWDLRGSKFERAGAESSGRRKALGEDQKINKQTLLRNAWFHIVLLFC